MGLGMLEPLPVTLPRPNNPFSDRGPVDDEFWACALIFACRVCGDLSAWDTRAPYSEAQVLEGDGLDGMQRGALSWQLPGSLEGELGQSTSRPSKNPDHQAGRTGLYSNGAAA